MNEQYIAPEAEILAFTAEDVITTSGFDVDYDGGEEL